MKQSSYYYIDKKKAYVKKVSPEKKKKEVLLKNEIIEDTRREIIPLLLLLVLGLLLFGLIWLVTSKLDRPATTIVQEQNAEPVSDNKSEQNEDNSASELPVEPVVSVEKEPKPTEVKLNKIDYMDKSRVMTHGAATSIRNKEYTNTLLSYREGYIIYCLDKEYDELKATFCVEYGSTLETEVSIEFAAIEDGHEYSLPINCDGASSYRLCTNGYDHPKEFSVDLRDVDVLKIYMHPHYTGLSYGGDDSSIIIGNPLLIKY